jgi:hypothetical protein
MVRTVSELRRLELGFDPTDLRVISLTHPYTYFQTPESFLSAMEEVTRRLEATPGIEAATPGVIRPLASSGLDVVVRTEEQGPSDVDRNPYLSMEVVLPGYFRALGIPLSGGRFLQPGDRRGGEPVVVVSEKAARALWPGRDAVGRRINLGFPGYEDTWWRVVGVAGDTRYRDFLDPRPSIYFPMGPMGAVPPFHLLVRTTAGGPESLRPLVSEALASLDGSVRVLGETPVSALLRGPTARPRFAAGVLLTLALSTLILAVLGVYAVFSVWAAEREREMGVRMALGADRKEIVRLVLAGVLRIAVPGAGVGLLAAVLLSPSLGALLFGISSWDPLTLSSVTASAVLLAGLAALPPAVRASATDPSRALRSE